jgi:catechol 2,3-dioxygenase-like lactoylglutathione lyase family enzyme
VSAKAPVNTVPQLDGILETALYVDDLDIAKAFYATVMGLPEIFSDIRMAVYGLGDDRVLLLFKRGASAVALEAPGGGVIPPHDGSGPIHIAFAVADADFPAWETYLAAHDIYIESRIDWPRGGHAIYFRDPDGHLLELASRRLWHRK